MKFFAVRIGRRVAVAGFLSLCLASAFGAPAQAELKYCNHSSFYILSAVAYVENKEWRSRGWIPLRPGECRVVMKKDMSTSTIFTYAEGHQGHRGEIRTWEGRIQFCTGKDRFDISGRENCKGRGYEVRHFARLDKNERAKDWTMEFREMRPYSLDRALIAGVQRLLFDVGYNAGQIDGYKGRRTILSMRAFQSRAGMKVDGRPSFELIDKLLERAAAIQTQSGYWLCNKTDLQLWAAIGYSKGKTWTSRGWWKVPAGECVKPVKDRLESRFFYTYAEAEGKNGERIIWGGDHPLCTGDVVFEIEGNEDCAARGYEKTGFQRKDTQGRNGFRQDFVLQGAQAGEK